MSAPAAVAVLPYGIYAGRVLRVDSAARLMTYEITASCASPSSGVWAVPLIRATFWVTSDPKDPARGHTDEVSFEEWADQTRVWKEWEVKFSQSELRVGNGPSAWCDGG